MKLEIIAIRYLCLGVWFTCYTQQMIFFGHPGVIDFYMKLKLGFEGEDPFDKFNNRYDRMIQCDYLLTANFYSLSNGPLIPNREANSNIRVQRNVQAIGPHFGRTDRTLEYQPLFMTIGSEIVSVKAFPCIIGPESTIFLTYGFTSFHKRMFVLIKPMLGIENLTTPLTMVAVLEPNSLINTANHYINYRFSTFIGAGDGASTSTSTRREHFLESSSSVQIGPTGARTYTGLRISSKFQHFRLCCSVANELGNHAHFRLDIKAYNFVYSMIEVHEQAKCILDENGKFITYAHVLPCAINQPWNEPQFYLLRDRYNPSSVFLFRPIKDEMYGESLRLEAVVDEVCALSDA